MRKSLNWPALRNPLKWAAFGVIATLFGMATGHFIASLLNPASSPVLAVGSTVIDLTPTPIKEWAVANFGTKDKPILIGSVLAGVLVLAAVAGVLTKRRFFLGAGMLVVLVAVAAGAALTRPAVEIVDVVPSLLTGIAGVGALWFLWRSASSAEDAASGSVVSTSSTNESRSTNASTSTSGEPEIAIPAFLREGRTASTRRGVLIASSVLTAGAVVLGGAGRWIGKYRSRPENINLPDPTTALRPLPSGLDKQVPGISKWVTPNDSFYRVDTRLDVPIVDSDSWSLIVDGDVENELEISFEELLAMPMMERDITLTCVSNSVGGKYVGAARWLGVPLKDILEKAGVKSGADQILSTDFDGMTISTPLELATDGRDAMVCVGMNGEPLPREHGFPVRMVIPGLYGFISATKWLTRITLTTYEKDVAYWTERKWGTDAPIKISTRIDTPGALEQLPKGETVIGGVAWAQAQGGVKQVEVAIDGGAWQVATLGPDGGNDYWRQWFYKWDATESGNHSIAARMTSGEDEEQSTARANPFPDGASGIQQLFVTVT